MQLPMVEWFAGMFIYNIHVHIHMAGSVCLLYECFWHMWRIKNETKMVMKRLKAGSSTLSIFGGFPFRQWPTKEHVMKRISLPLASSTSLIGHAHTPSSR